ncbi:hypothetical protein SCOCK_630029 [Actinacidiphila cocklensis]|uniref:Uncharacterized protein n=1 Tax=Actinacidiphila cocklensis TaxID=887465 RepID=A0A9W4GUF6_9ACTN|nr:hypothetical protein SCOCK_630029 [Actinacidiphila cocklensis]
MVDQAGVLLDLLPPQCHLQGVQRQVGSHVGGGLPAHDPSGVRVQDERHVNPARPGPDVGQVGQPQLVRPLGDEAAVDQVGRPRGGRLRDDGAAALSTDDALDAQLAHQLLDGASGHLMACADQRAGDPAGTIRAAGLLPHGRDQRDQLLVTHTAGRLRPLLAREVRRRRQLEHPADGIEPRDLHHAGGRSPARPRPGTVDLLRKKHRGSLQDLVRPPQLGVLLAEFLQLVAFGGGETVVTLTGVGLGLTDPAPQGLGMDPKVFGDVGDGPAAGADLADGALAELVRVFTWCWHCRWFSLRPDRNPGIRDSTKLRAAHDAGSPPFTWPESCACSDRRNRDVGRGHG